MSLAGSLLERTILTGWPERESLRAKGFYFVIASQINVGGFADVGLSEAIQLSDKKDWIASSQELLAMTNVTA